MLAEMVDAVLAQAQFFQRGDGLLPLGFPRFPLGQIEICNQFAEPLKRDCPPVIVVVFDNLLLIFGITFVHVDFP